ncbi:carboxymuconolactone decarboxylase family protein [Actinoplanes sp. Pm04-4]|uniref:Carboxymuconolactone decarboxylase family protein n=1 Tax=Paractinoplanes pyxinae TaxID=2997416 RepID=A0ABT4ASL7_9ACTN|nr:carboxymuconolactone decarboxylase family protein [Actinoplanes pyxinae]MCY1137234.1 carboxymuconolactone decarboxylase family protein [Actinoplanes pyxinae]
MRIADTDPATMTDEQRALYDIYTSGKRVAPDSPFTLVAPDGRLIGPPAVWIINPAFGRPLQQIGSAVRYGSQIPARAREIAILLVGHHHKSAFELYAHERAGAAAGLSEADLSALANGEEPVGLSDIESVVHRTTVRILNAGTVDDDEFRAATKALGEQGLLELTTIVGYYNMVAWQLAVFDVQPPAPATRRPEQSAQPSASEARPPA